MISITEILAVSPPFTLFPRENAPYLIEAGEAFLPGATEGLSFQSGGSLAQSFAAGASDAQVSL